MPAFQHRHYAAIADVLADVREAPAFMGVTSDAIDAIERRLIIMFKNDNPGFKPDRFERAARRAPNMHGKDKR